MLSKTCNRLNTFETMSKMINVWNLRNDEGGGHKQRDAGLRLVRENVKRFSVWRLGIMRKCL